MFAGQVHESLKRGGIVHRGELLSAISFQRTAISGQLSAISYQRSAFSNQLSAVSFQQSAIRNGKAAFFSGCMLIADC
jgi:hypothetical protein